MKDKTEPKYSDSDNESSEILDNSNYIGPFTDKLVKDFIHEIRKERNMDKIRSNVVDPVLCDINNRYFPHMVSLITLLVVIVLLLTVLLVMNFGSSAGSTNSTGSAGSAGSASNPAPPAFGTTDASIFPNTANFT